MSGPEKGGIPRADSPHGSGMSGLSLIQGGKGNSQEPPPTPVELPRRTRTQVLANLDETYRYLCHELAGRRYSGAFWALDHLRALIQQAHDLDNPPGDGTAA